MVWSRRTFNAKGKEVTKTMPTYVLLIKWTEEGIKTVQDAPNRIERARSMWKSAGGALKDLYFTFGKYDMIAIAEAPSDEAAAKLALQNGTYGMVRVETLKAFPEAEGLEIIKGLP
ncbi:MAG: GYD domain-containing protein [Halobacteriota archaeon]